MDKYYDQSQHRFLRETDGCKYENWQDKSDNFSFAIHPEGFTIFLTPSQLKNSDEYSENDPYTVEQNIDGEFHKRRIDSTICLLNSALGGISKARILDIGCGEGHITAEIQKNFLGAEVSALDYSISAINYAVEKFPGIDFCVADAYNPPYADNYFDVVVCNNLWEHIPDPLALLKGMNRILKDGGHIILSTPSRYRLSNLVNVLRGRPPVFMSIHHVTEYSVGQVIEQLRWGGYDVKKVYSKPIRNQSKGIKSIIAYQVILPILRTYLKVINSHHSLESTVFFLAKKKRHEE